MQREQAEIILTSGKALKTILMTCSICRRSRRAAWRSHWPTRICTTFCERLVWLWQADAEEKGIGLQLDIDEAVPARHRFDAVRLGQCISNLLSNAVKFTERGEITIRVSGETHPQGTAISIEIADSGIGMSTETVRKLFEPFSQGGGIDRAALWRDRAGAW